MKISIVLIAMCFSVVPLTANANYDVERLMDSYIIAKAENQFPTLNEEELKKNPYTIQVASYVNEKDAISHVEELRLQEKDVMYYPAFVRGQVWFKVCVGKFDKKDLAENYKRSFVKRMDEPFAVVISLLDRPKRSNTKAVNSRDVASVAKKETTVLPNNTTSSASSDATAPAPKVVLMPKVKAAEKAVESKNKAAAYYSLQVGAYPSEKLAKENIESLSIEGQDVYYLPAMVAGKQWFRVFVGKFVSKQDAESYQKIFKEKAKGAESFIRRVTASE